MLVERDARLLGNPAVAAADTPLVATAHVGMSVTAITEAGTHQFVVRQGMEHHSEVDVLRPHHDCERAPSGAPKMENFGKKKCSIDA